MSRILLKNALIWPSKRKVDILVEGKKIIKIGEKLDALEDDEVIEAKEKVVFPGFFNTHVHLYGVDGPLDDDLIRSFVKGGCTTVRDMGMTSPLDYQVYTEWLSKRRTADFPTVFASSKFLSGKNTYGTMHPSGKLIGYVIDETHEGARKAVDEMVDAGADQIKTGLDYGMDPNNPLDYLPDDCFRAICERAKERGVPSAAHITKPDNMVKAAKLGLTEAAHTPTEVLSDEEVKTIKESGMYVNTTMSIFDQVSKATGEDIMDAVLQNVRKLYRAGVQMSLGTDYMHEAPPEETAGIPVHELQLCIKAGLTIEEAIKLGTEDAAKVCRLSGKKGCIAEGMDADLFISSEEVNETFEAFRPEKIKFVMHEGKVIINR